jgi:hypothetical protein
MLGSAKQHIQLINRLSKIEFWSLDTKTYRALSLPIHRSQAQAVLSPLFFYSNKSLTHGTPYDSNRDLCFHTAGGPSPISATDVSTEE